MIGSESPHDWTSAAGFFYDVTVTSTSVVTGKNFGNTKSSIIGKIFGFSSRREDRRDLLILVTPNIIKDPGRTQAQ